MLRHWTWTFPWSSPSIDILPSRRYNFSLMMRNNFADISLLRKMFSLLHLLVVPDKDFSPIRGAQIRPLRHRLVSFFPWWSPPWKFCHQEGAIFLLKVIFTPDKPLAKLPHLWQENIWATSDCLWRCSLLADPLMTQILFSPAYTHGNSDLRHCCLIMLLKEDPRHDNGLSHRSPGSDSPSYSAHVCTSFLCYDY
jgi:hypothetical protein